MLKILLTGKAIADIKNIYDYIFEDSPQNAEMIKSEILSTVKRLCVFPKYGCTVVRTAFAKNGLPLFCQQKSICHFL